MNQFYMTKNRTVYDETSKEIKTTDKVKITEDKKTFNTHSNHYKEEIYKISFRNTPSKILKVLTILKIKKLSIAL